MAWVEASGWLGSRKGQVGGRQFQCPASLVVASGARRPAPGADAGAAVKGGDVFAGKGLIGEASSRGASHRLDAVKLAQGDDLLDVIFGVETPLFQLLIVIVRLGRQGQKAQEELCSRALWVAAARARRGQALVILVAVVAAHMLGHQLVLVITRSRSGNRFKVSWLEAYWQGTEYWLPSTLMPELAVTRRCPCGPLRKQWMQGLSFLAKRSCGVWWVWPWTRMLATVSSQARAAGLTS